MHVGAGAKAAHNTLRPSPVALAALSGLGVLSALWALFLWGELVRSRAGGSPFCPLGGDAQCSALWDGPFAAAVHRLSGIPVAGWGLLWGLVAFALPLAALVEKASGKEPLALLSAVRLTAAAGVAALFVLLAVSAAERSFCVSCAATYALVAGYAGIALAAWRSLGLPQLQSGLRFAFGAFCAAFLLLLYPGSRTPKSAAEASRLHIPAEAGSGSSTGAGASDPLTAFVASLDGVAKQTLSDSLHIYAKGPSLELWAPRVLLGPKDAPVRITEFTDVRCTHCAELHRALEQLEHDAPPGSFAVEPRHFPLDGECNTTIQRRADPVRCLAAKTQICLEGHEKSHDYTGRLFARQSALDTSEVYALAVPYMARGALEQCVSSAETSRKLAEDLFLAMKYEPEGTPLVVVNGRKAVAYPPFLYAIVLTRGASDHPAFRSLPKANPRAHVH